MKVFEYLSQLLSSGITSEYHEGELDSLPDLTGDRIFEVVGESFYAASFRRLMRSFRLRPGDETEVTAVLQLAPENKFSSSGKAVAVYVHGFQVGHIPEGESSGFFDKISERGNRAKAKARIWFDDRTTDRSRSSVRVHAFSPLRFADEPAPLGYQTSSSFYLKFSPEKQRQVDELFERRLTNGPGDLPELTRGSGIFKSGLPNPDDRFIEELMKRNGYKEQKIRLKEIRADLMIVADEAGMAESVHTPNALSYGIPIVTMEELFDAYPKHNPGPHFRSKRFEFYNWQQSLEEQFGYRTRDEDLISLFRNHRLVAPGNSFCGRIEISASYSREEDPGFSSAYFEVRQELMQESGAGFRDSLFLLGTLGTKRKHDRLPITFEGVEIGLASEDATANFQTHLNDNLSRDVVVQLGWIAEDDIVAEFNMRYDHPLFTALFGFSKND